MSRTFTVPTDPYDDGVRLFKRKDVVFNPGLTALIGCNGTGKSTLLRLMEKQLKKQDDAVCLAYNDRTDGGNTLSGRFLHYGMMEDLARYALSSEGERIHQGIENFVSGIRRYVMAKSPKEVWILMDAVGSGLSLDKIREIKDFVGCMEEDPEIKELYFVVATNEFEFAINADCIDVTTFDHMLFSDGGYAEYRDYILNTAEKKQKRYDRITKRNRAE